MSSRESSGAEGAFAFIAEQTSDVIVRTNAQGILTYVSPAARRYGYEPEDLIGVDHSALVHPDDLASLTEKSQAVIQGEVDPSVKRHHRFRKADGDWVWFEGNPKVVFGPDGKPAEIINIFRDISARLALEEAADAQAEQFESAFNHAPIGMALVGLNGSFLRANAAFCRIVDYPEDDVLVLDFQSITHPEDLDADLELLKRLTAGEIDSYRMDKRYIRSDGEQIWVHLSVSMVRGADGAPKLYVAQVEDLTERRQAEAALRESEARYRLIADSIHDVIMRMDEALMITYISPSVRTLGYAPEDVVGRHAYEWVHPEDRKVLEQNVVVRANGRPIPVADHQFRLRTASGGWAWMEGSPRVLQEAGGPSGMITVLRNITERREQEALFEAAFEHAAIGKSMVDLEGRFLKVNQAVCKLTGFSRDQLLTMSDTDLIHPEEYGMDEPRAGELIAGEIDSYETRRRYRRVDGDYVWVRMTVALVRHTDGRPKHFVAEVEDLTDRHAAEAALKASEARYRLIAENTSDMITMTDLAGQTIYASPSVRQAGVRPEELEGRSFAYSIHPDDERNVRRAFRHLLAEGGTTRIRWRGHDATSGGWMWLESNASLVRDPATGEPTGFLDVIRNVNLQVQQEETVALARADAESAAAAKSQFLANMSHEIRTPLTAVLGFTNLLRETELPEAAAGYVRRIAGAGNALLAIVNDILDFSKLEAGKFEIRPRPTHVAEVCEETLLLFSGQAEAKGLAIRFEADPGLPRAAMIDGDRLRQLLINLIGNAIKFTDEGCVTVRVSASEADAVAVEVADTGPGLDDEAQARLFQRFTQIDGSMTRQHGGTGLGLAISRGIAEAMGGAIGVTSLPGQGATFRVDLPAPPAELPEELAGEAPVMSIEGVRVLVVDDNPVNRELSRRILEAAGAEVSEAVDGAEALEQLAQLPVDVVLMDLRMPILDGRAALRALRATAGPNQDVPVVAFTADADLEGDGDLDGFDGLVRKPIQPLDMYAAIGRATQWAPIEQEDVNYAAG